MLAFYLFIYLLNSAPASTLLGVPYWWVFQDAELTCVLSHLLHKRKLPQLLTLKLSCILSLREAVIALYNVLWMMWEHPDVTCFMPGLIIDGSFFTLFFDH